MENNSRNKIIRSKVMGLICLIVFSLAFIFACLKNVLPIGFYIAGTFGILTYPLMITFMILSLAKALGLSYTRNSKATTLILLFLISTLYAIHSIATFKPLNLVVGFKTLGTYLKYSYETLTLAGGFGSIFCGLISILLGAMGTIIICVILATLFLGLFVDYELYGKYEKPNVKILKSGKLRNKVENSDKNVSSDGTPEYSFSNIKDSDVVGEISLNQEDNTQSEPRYNDSDVVGEISDNGADSNAFYGTYQGTNNFDNNYVSDNYQDGNQEQNNFSNDFYQEKNIPDVYSEDMNEYRRQFMNATFGRDTSTQSNNQESSFNSYQISDSEQESNSPEIGSFNTDNDFNQKPNEFENYNDTLSQILNSSEDVADEKTDIEDNYNSGFSKPIQNENNFNSNSQNSGFGGMDISLAEPENIVSEKENLYGQNTLTNSNETNFRPEQNNIVSNVSNPTMSQIQTPVTPSVTVPQKPIAGQNPYGFNIAMPGIRYNPPPLSLLRTPKPDTGDYSEEQNRKSAQLEKVLDAFHIPAKVKNIVRGPKITRYELSMPYGVSVKKIPTYENDIAAALAAKTIVIKAPIPGSQYVGIELENDTFTSVYERELLESPEFQNSKDPLPIAIGKDISGEIVVKSMAKMVHLLIAGSTGSGKSVFIHNIVLSLIYKYGPDDLRLIMIDPKKVEFNRYNGLPHLLTPEVVMGAEKAINALKWCVKEMDRRYDLMNKAGYNNIEPYNKSELVKSGQFEHMPYIVIIVDELAEIMLANKKECEVCIQRITQLARACGMHLILATQRPSVDIISGVIKNNIPSRIAFSLQSGIDSKTILNAVGAEKLLGQGDMIFAPTGTSTTPRLQAAYASDDEIKAVIDYDKKYNQANYDERVESSFNAEQAPVDETGENGQFDAPSPRDTVDGYFKTAVKLVMMNGGASTSYLQRRLSIGYSRAARIIDQMEDKGYIASSTGSKLRKVLITPEQFKADFGEDYDSID